MAFYFYFHLKRKKKRLDNWKIKKRVQPLRFVLQGAITELSLCARIITFQEGWPNRDYKMRVAAFQKSSHGGQGYN